MNIGEVRQGKTSKWTLVFEDGDTVLATPEWDTAQTFRKDFWERLPVVQSTQTQAPSPAPSNASADSEPQAEQSTSTPPAHIPPPTDPLSRTSGPSD